MNVMAEFRKGDKVEWDSHDGTAIGEVLKKITSDTEATGRTFARPRTTRSTSSAVRRAAARRCTSRALSGSERADCALRGE
jgi:hypothetical protein